MRNKAPQPVEKQSKQIKPPVKTVPVKSSAKPKPPVKAPAKNDPKSNATAKPGKGGARPGAGRPAGAVSVEKKALREVAGVHSSDAVQTLAALFADTKQTGMVRVAAANSILDRAHGRPTQSLDVELNDVSGFSAAEKAALESRYEDAVKSGVWVKQKAEMKARKLDFEAGKFE